MEYSRPKAGVASDRWFLANEWVVSAAGMMLLGGSWAVSVQLLRLCTPTSSMDMSEWINSADSRPVSMSRGQFRAASPAALPSGGSLAFCFISSASTSMDGYGYGYGWIGEQKEWMFTKYVLYV